MNKRFYDTCSILENYDNMKDKHFYLSTVSLQELEGIKTSNTKSDEVKFRARRAIHMLNDNIGKYEVIVADNDIYSIVEKLNLPTNNDNLIMACAYSINKEEPIIFYTEDLCCKMIAKDIFKLNVESINDSKVKDEYKGYTYISGDSNYINDFMNDIDYSKWYVNQYLVIHNIDDKKDTEMRYNGESFVGLKLPPSTYIKAKNSLQRCALDLMLNRDITTVAILGGYGSGKTFLATQMALYNVNEKGNQSKVLGIRECSGEGKDVGYLKGTFEDKTGKFFKPLEQQLKGGEFELDSLISRGVLETNIPFYLKGTTYNNTIIVADESEDLSEAQIRLIGTRLGENSKIYFSGDYSQSISNKTLNNPLVKMCNELKGNPMFGCIVLDEDVRSSTSQMFANLFK